MTQLEFAQWQTWTERSAARWIVDPIHNGLNGRDLLVHKGGESGYYIMVMPDGVTYIGSYTGAIPHIGEACFRPEHTERHASFDEAVSRVFGALGLNFVIDYLLAY